MILRKRKNMVTKRPMKRKPMNRRRKPLPAILKRNAETLWNMVATDESGGAWAPCATGCGRWVPHGSEVHHIKAAGLGGKKDHSIENLEYRCTVCHPTAHGRRVK